MNRPMLAVALAAAFAVPALILPAAAQKGDAAQGVRKQVNKKAAKGRLPAYYATIVDDRQRQEIYGIQAEYHARIEALRAELEALVNERDEKIRGVLSPAQAQRLDGLIASAQAARAAKAAQKARAKKGAVPGKAAAAKKAP